MNSANAGNHREDVDYNRVSHDPSGAAEGTDSQHRDNAEWSEEEGRPLARTYVDNDISAYNGTVRPEYERMLRDIQAGQIRSVTVWHANRLVRNIDEASIFLKLAIKHGVRLYSYSKGGSYAFNRPSGRGDFLRDAVKGQEESEERGDRVALARKRQARQGSYGGGMRPYGWGVDSGRVRSVCVNPKDPPMERRYEDRRVLDMNRHNAQEAAEIRRWAHDLLSGVSQAAIVADLNRRGVPTVTQTDEVTVRRYGRVTERTTWEGMTIRGILTNPRTAGHSVYKGDIVQHNAYPEIISEEKRQALITLFADPARKTSPGSEPKWVGSLIVRCGVCATEDATMTVRYRRGQPVYRCRIKGHCSQPAHAVDAMLREMAIKRLSRPDLAKLVTTVPNVDVDALKTEAAVWKQKKTEAALQFAEDTIDAAQLATITAQLDTKITANNAAIAEATSEDPLTDFIGSSAEEAAQRWDSLPLGTRRETLRRLMTVTARPTQRGARMPPVARLDFTPKKPAKAKKAT